MFVLIESATRYPSAGKQPSPLVVGLAVVVNRRGEAKERKEKEREEEGVKILIVFGICLHAWNTKGRKET